MPLPGSARALLHPALPGKGQAAAPQPRLRIAAPLTRQRRGRRELGGAGGAPALQTPPCAPAPAAASRATPAEPRGSWQLFLRADHAESTGSVREGLRRGEEGTEAGTEAAMLARRGEEAGRRGRHRRVATGGEHPETAPRSGGNAVPARAPGWGLASFPVLLLLPSPLGQAGRERPQCRDCRRQRLPGRASGAAALAARAASVRC